MIKYVNNIQFLQFMMWLGQMFHQKYVISLKCGRMNACWCVLQRLTWRRVGLGQHHSSHQCMRLEDVVVDPRNEALHRIPGNLLTLIQVQTQQTKSPSVGGNPLILTDRCRVTEVNLSIFALFYPTAVAIAFSIRHGFDLKVRIAKVIDNVPAQLWKCLPLQQDAVTDAGGEEQLPVD